MIVVMCIVSVTSCKKEKIIGGEITQVTIHSFPMTDANGSNWDFLLGADANPDVELWFNRGGAISDEALPAEERYDNAESPGTFTFDEFGSTPWLIDVLDNNYAIGIYDYDTLLESDEMAVFTFNPSSSASGTSSTIELEQTGASISVTIKWIYE